VTSPVDALYGDHRYITVGFPRLQRGVFTPCAVQIPCISDWQPNLDHQIVGCIPTLGTKHLALSCPARIEQKTGLYGDEKLRGVNDHFAAEISRGSGSNRTRPKWLVATIWFINVPSCEALMPRNFSLVPISVESSWTYVTSEQPPLF
jgi:hypothetical protein